MAVAGNQQPALTVPAQAEIEHTGDRVRAVKCRCPVAQHLELADCDRWDRREIGTLRTANIGNVRELDGGAAMTALAVDEDQRLIRRQAAKREGPGEDGAVIADEALHIERRDLGAEEIVHIGCALFEQFRAGDNIDRLGGVGRLEIIPPCAGHDDVALRRGCSRCFFGAVLRKGRNRQGDDQGGDNRAARAKQFLHAPLPFTKALGFIAELYSWLRHGQK